MPDLFLSYSRRDSDKASELVEHLRAWGIDVWIDVQGIDAADQWPKEIVQAIWGCKAFAVLLSESSLVSTNVLRELSLAIEKQKPILPLKLSPVQLNEDFAYQLAGVQRISASDFDGIERSLRKLGIVPNREAHSPATGAARTEQQRAPDNLLRRDSRIALIVLPFENLSPPGEDNAWFADGLSGELIDALGHIKSLRILDRKTSLDLRGLKLRTIEIGREYNTRYFIEGTVRKFGEEIKISVSLLDIETGDYLWQESHRGQFQDIFDVQESVAKKVVDGLKLHLTKEESAELHDHGTTNTEAYRLFVKAQEYFDRHTREGFQLALQLATEAIALDPRYAAAYVFKASTLANLYRIYRNDSAILVDAVALARHALELKPDLWDAYAPLSMLHQLQRNLDEAERAAKTYIAHAPHNAKSHFTLAFFYDANGRYAQAIPPYESAVEINPEYLPYIWNLILACHHAGDVERRIAWALKALPLYERHLKFLPEDEFSRACYASLLHFAGRDSEALLYAQSLAALRDGTSLYSLACLYCELRDYTQGLGTFRRALDAGYRNQSLIERFLSNEKDGIASIAGTPEYNAIRQYIDALLAQNTSVAIP